MKLPSARSWMLAVAIVAGAGVIFVAALTWDWLAPVLATVVVVVMIAYAIEDARR